jgi:hypothetical protein
MGASPTLQALFRMPVAEPAFRRSEGGGDAASHCVPDTRIESIRNILWQTGYTAAQLSVATGKLYGKDSPYFIPPTFLYKLKCGITPQICQIAALSEITGYRFVDWMKICGFDLHQIPRLQLSLHTERTVLVTPIDFGSAALLSPWSRRYEAACGVPMNFRPDQYGSTGGCFPYRSRYLFAKIGGRDAFACPGLIPGSVVRIDCCYRRPIPGASESSLRNLLWLVEQPGGLTCCRVRWIEDEQIVLLPSRPPWGSWPLRVPAEARILGLVDTEFRPAQELTIQPRARPMKLEPTLPCRQERMKFSDLLRVSRCRTGLTFREAHRLTRVVATIQGNPDYSVALGLLSDYEAMGRLPRHIAKIISLCIAFCMDIRELLEVAGVKVDDSTKMPLMTHEAWMQTRGELIDEAPYYRTIVIGARYSHPAAGQLENISQM